MKGKRRKSFIFLKQKELLTEKDIKQEECLCSRVQQASFQGLWEMKKAFTEIQLRNSV